MEKPGEGFLKDNIDGAFVQDSCVGAVRAVVLGSSGQLRLASARRLSLVGSALLAEAEALREGVPPNYNRHSRPYYSRDRLPGAEEQGCTSLRNCDNSERGGRVGGKLQSFRLMHTRRSANYSAHLCTHHSLDSFHDFV